MPESVIEIRDLRAGYGRSVVLHGISVTLDAKSVSVVLGPNGAGKTTLIRAICGGIPALAPDVACAAPESPMAATDILMFASSRLAARGGPP